MGRIIDFPQSGLGKIYNKIDEFHEKHSKIYFKPENMRTEIEKEQYSTHLSILRYLNISFFITISIYLIMVLFLVLIIKFSDNVYLNKVFGAICLFFSIIPLSLLVWWEIERRWQFLSRKIGHA